VLQKSLDELEYIQMEDGVKNVLVTIIKLVTNSGNAEAMVRRLWKPVKFHVQHDNKIELNYY
jgi:DNA transposition AAA+ family ATPase